MLRFIAVRRSIALRRSIAVSILLLPVALAPACGQPARICDLVAECEHYNDLAEDFNCEQISAGQDIAEIYGCLEEWTAFADCFEEKGTCDEEEANYTTREPGSCSSTSSTGIGCTDNSDCLGTGAPGSSCDNGTCVYPSCADPDAQGFPCQSDSECPGGDDKCEEESTKLVECVSEATDQPGAVGFGFGFDFD